MSADGRLVAPSPDGTLLYRLGEPSVVSVVAAPPEAPEPAGGAAVSWPALGGAVPAPIALSRPAPADAHAVEAVSVGACAHLAR